MTAVQAAETKTKTSAIGLGFADKAGPKAVCLKREEKGEFRLMKKSIWVLAAAMTLPAVAAMGQQNGTSNGDNSNGVSQPRQENNHAMQTGSPNDNGAGLTGNYGKTEAGKKGHKKHHHHKSKKHRSQMGDGQAGTRGTGEVNPQ